MKPQWHYRPESNWINDPNGLTQVDGWYHLYYQYNPHGDVWGDIHWGHARSRDLLHWETLPIALTPDAAKGELHCFSGGCCKDENGKPHFFYTSVGAAEDGRDCVHGAQQWYAEPTDDTLTTLIQTDEYALTDAIHGGMHVRDWRDPCVLRHRGQYLMVLGGCVEERGCVLLYTSPDMRSWTYRHILAQSDKADGIPWECPNLFEVDGKFGLIYSPCAQVRIKLGMLDEGLRFHEEGEEILEPDRNGFYAPQVFRDEQGRSILIGWMPEADRVAHKGWSGVMSLPRVLSITEDGLCAQPIPGADNLPGVQCQQILREDLPKTWVIHDNGTEQTLLTLTADGLLCLDRSRSTLADGPEKHPITRTVPVKDVNDVFIAVDASAVEVMVNGKWLSGRIYPTK
ncbi:MAG: glycoside hydrolase family 32 protein [Clostridia bacterium]|nr:glycoside hydrolase family 32 protein [Clostridia bacterium]